MGGINSVGIFFLLWRSPKILFTVQHSSVQHSYHQISVDLNEIFILPYMPCSVIVPWHKYSIPLQRYIVGADVQKVIYRFPHFKFPGVRCWTKMLGLRSRLSIMLVSLWIASTRTKKREYINYGICSNNSCIYF